MADEKKDEKTVEEQLAELQAKMTEMETTSESHRVEAENLRNEKGKLLKEKKTTQEALDKLKAAQMSDDERKNAETGKLSALEAQLARTAAEATRYRILSTTPHGLDPLLVNLVEGDDDVSIKASIESLKAQQAEMLKRVAPPASPGTAPTPPSPAGGHLPELTEKDVWNMTPEQMTEFEHQVKTGEIQVSSE